MRVANNMNTLPTYLVLRQEAFPTNINPIWLRKDRLLVCTPPPGLGTSVT